TDKATLPSFINESENQLLKTRSRTVSTERTILSPFTKEYRVLAAHSGICLFLEAYFLFRNGPSSSSSKYSFNGDPLLAANTGCLLDISDNTCNTQGRVTGIGRVIIMELINMWGRLEPPTEAYRPLTATIAQVIPSIIGGLVGYSVNETLK
ncbi:hypothetical protein Goshw_005361, partial [Gossypium schwendimanii]|nr:hypothetical protein [Gossypium schwendimanii]